MTSFSRTAFLLTLAVSILLGLSAQAAILELTGPAGASVVVNGRHRGFFPLEHSLDLGPGVYRVDCSLAGHKDYSWEIFLADESDWKRLHVRMTPYSKRTALGSNLLLAGLGQHYLDQPRKGWALNIVEAGGLITALYAESSRSNHRKDYLLLMDKYASAINSNDVAYFQAQAEKAYQDMLDKENLRDTGLLVAGTAVVLSMIDTLINFPGVKVGSGSGIAPAADPETQTSLVFPRDELTTVHAGIKLNF